MSRSTFSGEPPARALDARPATAVRARRRVLRCVCMGCSTDESVSGRRAPDRFRENPGELGILPNRVLAGARYVTYSILPPNPRIGKTIQNVVIDPSLANRSIGSSGTGLAGPADEHIRDLGTGELHRRTLPLGQEVPDRGSGQADRITLDRREGLGGDHAPGRLGPVGVLELEDGHTEAPLGAVHLDLVEEVLGVVRAVISADAGVVAPDDEVGAPVALADDGVG